MKEDDAIREFMGDRPSSEQLRDWRIALEERLAALKADRPRAGASLDGKIATTERQIDALREEEAVTRFVEDSVRVTLAMGASSDGMDEAEE